MSTKSTIKDEIIYDEKGRSVVGEIFSGEDLVTVTERINNDNTKYSYVETYENENGIIIIGSSSDLCLDKRGNVMPKRTIMGIWYYDTDFVNNIKDINFVIDNIDVLEDPIKDLEQFNSDIYYKKHILPDLFTSALICMKNDYANKGDNTSYAVEKQLPDGTIVPLSFVYAADADLRTQLQRLYHSIIGVNDLTTEYFKEIGICDTLRPSEDESALFDANKFIKNMKNKVAAKADTKSNDKQLVK